jgi:hypothetical protein
MYTKEQQEMLKQASSGLKPEAFAKLDEKEVEEIMARLHEVYINIHMTSPYNLLTTLRLSNSGDVKIIDDTEALQKRDFYDRPRSLRHDEYRSVKDYALRPFKKIKVTK